MNVWLYVFVVSLIMLGVLIFRRPYALKWLSYIALNIVVAGAIIYLFNGLQLIDSVRIPINAVTLISIALLGVPGMAAIIIIKTFII